MNEVCVKKKCNQLISSFKETSSKFTTIVIGSMLVTTTPLWYFITNLMSGIRIITAVLVICCAPCIDYDDGRESTIATCISCVSCLITFTSALTNGIAWLVRKVSKWTVRICAKLLLISFILTEIIFHYL